MLPGGAFKSPLKCAHLAGESKTIGYSVARTPTIFSFAVSNSSRDIQKGHAKCVWRGITESSVIIVGRSKCFRTPCRGIVVFLLNRVRKSAYAIHLRKHRYRNI